MLFALYSVLLYRAFKLRVCLGQNLEILTPKWRCAAHAAYVLLQIAPTIATNDMSSQLLRIWSFVRDRAMVQYNFQVPLRILIVAKTICKSDLDALSICEIHVAHRQGILTLQIDVTVVEANLFPRLQGKALVCRAFLVAADHVRNCTFTSQAKVVAVFTCFEGKGWFEENLVTFGVSINGVNELRCALLYCCSTASPNFD